MKWDLPQNKSEDTPTGSAALDVNKFQPIKDGFNYAQPSNDVTEPKLTSAESPLYTKITPGVKRPIRMGDSVADIVSKLYNLIKFHDKDNKTQHEIEHNFQKELFDNEDHRRNEILKIFKKKKQISTLHKTKSTKKTEKKKDKSGPGGILSSMLSRLATATESLLPKALVPLAKTFAKGAVVGAVTGAGIGIYEQLKASEGLGKAGKPGVAYGDVGGKQTIGVGHLITKDEKKQGFIQIGDEQVKLGATLSNDQMDVLLKQDVEKTTNIVKSQIGKSWDKLNDNQKDALVSYAYNIGGVKSLIKKGLIESIESGNTEKGASIVGHGINTVDGVAHEGLTKRRHDEENLYKTPPSIRNIAPNPNTLAPIQTSPRLQPEQKPDNLGAKSVAVADGKNAVTENNNTKLVVVKTGGNVLVNNTTSPRIQKDANPLENWGLN